MLGLGLGSGLGSGLGVTFAPKAIVVVMVRVRASKLLGPGNIRVSC